MNKNITFFITDNIGEIYFIFPIAYDLIKNKNIEIKIIFTNEIIYKNFNEKYLEDLDPIIKSKISALKFLFDEKKFIKPLRIVSKFLNILFNFNIIFKSLKSSDFYFIESSFRTSFGRFLLIINNLIFKKDIFVYMQGLSPFVVTKNSFKFSKVKRKFKINHLAISNSEKEINELIQAGYDTAIPLGYPIKSAYFYNLKEKYQKNENLNILFLPRAIGPKLSERDAEKYLMEIKRITEKYFPHNKIVIHLHLKERSNFFIKTIKNKNLNNIVVKSGNPIKEIINSRLVICNLTSAIFIAYCLNIPAVELFIGKNETSDFIKSNVTTYSQMGFESYRDFDSFEKFIKNFDNENFKFNLKNNFDNLDTSSLTKAILNN